MARLTWHNPGDREFELGVDRGVLYPYSASGNPVGVAWNGLVSVSEEPTVGEPDHLYIDGYKYHTYLSSEEFEATVSAFTYPKEFEACDGSALYAPGFLVEQQPRLPFGMVYRTKIGNDIEGQEFSYKLHLIYNALALPTVKPYSTLNDSPEALLMSWSLSTKPELLNGYKPSAHFVLDSTEIPPGLMADIEDILYGTDLIDPILPDPIIIKAMIENYSDLVILDLGNGLWSGSGSSVNFLGSESNGYFEIDHDNVVDNGDGTFTASSEE